MTEPARVPWIALVRHGRTDWNERGLLQGRTDIPLSAATITELQQVQLGDDFLQAHWVTSPLKRAQQTAAILNPQCKIDVQPQLIEMNWGEFEGLCRTEIPQRINQLGLDPATGLDFTPPGGESPRQVRQRIMQWFEMVATCDQAIVAVTHKGVIRSALSAACGWDMAQDFSQKLDWSLPHIFQISSSGKLALAIANCSWQGRPAELCVPPRTRQ